MDHPSTRLIAIDTETTGFSNSDKIVEIACIEIENGKVGSSFHRYVNPTIGIPDRAFNVHGLSKEFLSDKPKFKSIADDFLEFIGDSTLVIHNASYDLRMINNELKLIGYSALNNESICTLKSAKKSMTELVESKSLDSLCDYFEIDRTKRSTHGALVDTELLADLFITMERKGYL